MLTTAQLGTLKTIHDLAPRGRRNRLVLGWSLDLGLRVGEVVGLTVGAYGLRPLDQDVYLFESSVSWVKQAQSITPIHIRAAATSPLVMLR